MPAPTKGVSYTIEIVVVLCEKDMHNRHLRAGLYPMLAVLSRTMEMNEHD